MNYKNIFGAVLAIACLSSITASAQTTPYSVYSRGSTNGATALSGVIIGANSANNGTPVVTMIDANSDKAASVVQSYRVTSETPCTATNSATSLYVVPAA